MSIVQEIYENKKLTKAIEEISKQVDGLEFFSILCCIEMLIEKADLKVKKG
ncbi:MAG: hypothetical protein GY782_09180 [Gammaproteobacteria bacterium]|nr:hypothetical protein [Gammaproteobacteria bacterium]